MKLPSRKKPSSTDNNIRSLKRASDSTKSPTWGGNIRKIIQAGYDAKRLLRNDTFRPRKHVRYDKTRLIGVVIHELLYARAAVRTCLIGGIIFELRLESFEAEPPPRGDKNSKCPVYQLPKVENSTSNFLFPIPGICTLTSNFPIPEVKWWKMGLRTAVWTLTTPHHAPPST